MIRFFHEGKFQNPITFARNSGCMKLLLITIVMLGLAVAGIAVKLLFKKDGKFSGTCASQSPFLNAEGEACSLCGARPQEQCKNT